MLRSHAVRLRLDPLFSVLDGAEQQLLARDTVRAFVLQRARDGDAGLRELVATLGYAPVVSAFAFALSQRAKAAVHHLCPDAAELARRWQAATDAEVALVLQQVRGDPEVASAAEALRYTIPTDAADRLGAYREAVLADLPAALDPERPLDEAVNAWVTIAGRRKPGNAGAAANWPGDGKVSVLAAIRRLQEAGAPFQQWAGPGGDFPGRAVALTAAFHAALPEALEAYAAAKRDRSAVDFDDQLLLARDLLRDHPDVRRAEQERFDYVLVDEFQDTDPVQREIVWYLSAGGAKPGGLQDGRLFIVGDAKQSIYAFRGADVRVYNATRRGFAAVGAANCLTLSLTANFRSQPRLVAFFNELFRHPEVMGPDADRLPDHAAAYEPLQATRPAPEGGPDVDFLLSLGEGPLPELRELAAEGIARYITELIAGRAPIVGEAEGPARAATWRDITVLLPTMTSLALYERALREWGVPYYVVAGKGYFQRPEVMDLVALLKAIEEPRDEVSLARLLRAPCVGVSDEGLYWLAKGAGLSSGMRRLGDGEEAPGLSADDRARALRLAEAVAQLRAVRHHLSLAELLERALGKLDLLQLVAARFDGVRSYANLRKLVEIARRLEATEPATLSRFVDHVETLRTEEFREGEAAAEEQRGDAVCVMTVHASKGLERPVVIVADLARASGPQHSETVILHDDLGPIVKGEMDDGTLAFPPLARAARDLDLQRSASEDRRLLYVALTRARDRLVISTPIGLRADGSPARAGVWVDCLLAAFPELLSSEETLVGAAGDWSARVTRLAPSVIEARSRRPRSALDRERARLQRGEALPGGDAAAEQAILERLCSFPPDLAAKTRFTVTELAHYLDCPRRYELEHVRGLAAYLPARETLATGRLRAHERGTIVHRALQRLGRGPISEIRDEVEAAVVESGLAGHDPEEIERIIAVLVRFTGSETWELVRTAAELRSEVPLVAPLAGAVIEGQVDALLRDRAGGLHLIDYKTGRAQDAGTAAEHRFQVGAYAAALRQACGRLPATVVVHYLDADERVAVDPAAEADDATQQIAEAVRGIRARRFPRRRDCADTGCRYGWVCMEPGPGR